MKLKPTKSPFRCNQNHFVVKVINLCRALNQGIFRKLGGNVEEKLENHGKIPHFESFYGLGELYFIIIILSTICLCEKKAI